MCVYIIIYTYIYYIYMHISIYIYCKTELGIVKLSYEHLGGKQQKLAAHLKTSSLPTPATQKICLCEFGFAIGTALRPWFSGSHNNQLSLKETKLRGYAVAILGDCMALVKCQKLSGFFSPLSGSVTGFPCFVEAATAGLITIFGEPFVVQ